VVLVTHGDTLAEHGAFFKRLELEILPELHCERDLHAQAARTPAKFRARECRPVHP